MVEYVSGAKNPLQLVIERKWKKIEITVIPKDGKIGSYIGYNITSTNDKFLYKYPIGEAIQVWFWEMYAQSRLTLGFMWDLISKLIAPKNEAERKEAVGSLSGPVWVGSMFVWLVDAKVTASVIFLIMAVISINLWVFNLLPFPALDGWRFFFMILGGFLSLFMKKNTHIGYIESVAHVVWFVILIGLSIFVAYQDIARLFQ
jgi:regulator of sigma E protease